MKIINRPGKGSNIIKKEEDRKLKFNIMLNINLINHHKKDKVKGSLINCKLFWMIK